MFGRDDKKRGGDVVGFIGKGMYLEGKLSFDDTVRIDGSFKGEISAAGTLVVGEGGVVEGQIKVGSAIITGEVKGLLEASGKVELQSPGKVFGNIKTPTLIIGEGVIFEGNCVMLKRDAEPEIIDFGTAEGSEIG